MNTDNFTGKADAYAAARPGYPDIAIEYIRSLVSRDAVFADVGAGTGKFTELLAKFGYRIFAVEPNADMRAYLSTTLAPFPDVEIIDGSAESTTLPDRSVDVITCAQALHWFDLKVFSAECRRIGKPGFIVISVYNISPGGNSVLHSKQSNEAFFTNPVIKDFPNTIYYTREKWLTYMTSHSHNPLPSDPGFAAHIEEMNKIFDQDSVDGLLCNNVITRVCSERM